MTQYLNWCCMHGWKQYAYHTSCTGNWRLFLLQLHEVHWWAAHTKHLVVSSTKAQTSWVSVLLYLLGNLSQLCSSHEDWAVMPDLTCSNHLFGDSSDPLIQVLEAASLNWKQHNILLKAWRNHNAHPKYLNMVATPSATSHYTITTN